MAQFSKSIGNLSSIQQGIYVACILLSASISSLTSGHVSDRISRRYGIFSGGLITLVGTIISAASSSFGSLIGARIITGIGIGQAMSVTTVYLVEIAPAKRRGVTAGLLQFYLVIGVTVGYFVAFGSRNLQGSIAWRTPFIIQSGIALILCIGMLFVPFSPRWLIQADRKGEAQRVLRQLRDREDAEQELLEIEASLFQGIDRSSANFMEMFQPRYLRRTLLGIFLMICLQMTGVSSLSLAHIFWDCAKFNTYHIDRCHPLFRSNFLSASRLYI